MPSHEYRAVPASPIRTFGGRSEDDGLEYFARQSMDVLVADRSPIDTGLVNAEGDKIMRIVSRAPCGFCR